LSKNDLIKEEKNMNKKSKMASTFKRMNTKRTRIVIIIIAVIVIALVANNIIKAKNEKTAIFEVKPMFETAMIGDISYNIAGDGNLGSGSSRTFDAQTALSIENVMVAEGQSVNADQVMATLDKADMQENLLAVEYLLNEMQATVDNSYIVEDTFYIKAPFAGRLKDIQVEEDDYVEDAMQSVGYIALISLVDEMKIEVDEDEAKVLKQKKALTVRVGSYKYDEDAEFREIDGESYVVIPTAARDVGDKAKIYSKDNSRIGNEIADGVLELVSYEKVKGTYGMISYQDDFENHSVDKGEVLFHVDQFRYTLENAYVQLEKLRAEYEYCKQLGEDLAIIAPYDGIVSSLTLVDDSDVAKDSMIAVLLSEDDWKAKVAVDELDINRVKAGQDVTISIDALDEKEYEGMVQGVSSFGVASGGITTYDVLVSVNDDDAFKIAMSLTSEIEVESANDAVIIPSSAIRTLGEKNYVMVEVERTSEQTEHIKQTILSGDLTALSKYMGQQINQDRGKERQTGDDEKGKKITDEKLKAMGKDKQSGTFLSNPVALLFAEVKFVEIGIEDGAYTQIISGLDAGEKVLLPINNSDKTDNEKDAGNPMSGFGKAMGGSRRK
jgi:HlyD family secretion protein